MKRSERREEIERELVRMDKQTLITECLKVYDDHTRIVLEMSATRAALDATDKANRELVDEIRVLERRTWIAVLNDTIRDAVTRKKDINKHYKTAK